MISHYEDPTLLAVLGKSIYAFDSQIVLDGMRDGTIRERNLATDKVTRIGRLVRISIEWEE